MKNILCTVFLTALLAGCSRIQLAYNQLDWLLPYYLETYTELTDQQSSYLEQEVDRLLAWHCSTQVGAYARLLRAASTDFRSDHMTVEKLADYSNRVEQFWNNILLQASPAIAGLLLDADEAQLRELFDSFQERNQEWLAEYRDTTPEEMHANYTERMQRELERWFGPLQPAQQQAVLEWADHFQPLGLDGLQARETWQSRLQELVSHRDDRATFNTGIHELFSNPETYRPSAYQKRLDYNREQTIELVYRVGSQLDARQRNHLEHSAESVARDFDMLSCDDEETATPASDTISQGLLTHI
jgi:hypothetical protein